MEGGNLVARHGCGIGAEKASGEGGFCNGNLVGSHPALVQGVCTRIGSGGAEGVWGHVT